MKTLKALLQKHKDIVLYVVFGGLTTLVNIVSFYVLEQLLAVATVPATCVAWALSVLFAYVLKAKKTPAGASCGRWVPFSCSGCSPG